MKVVKKCLMPIILAVVLLAACFIPAFGNKNKITVNADDFNDERVYYFSDIRYTAIPEDSISTAFDEYSIRIFDSDVLHALIATGDADDLLSSSNYKHWFGTDSFSTQALCKVVFEFVVNKPDSSAVQTLFADLRAEGYKVMVISGYTQDECDYGTVDAFYYIDYVGCFIDAFLDDVNTTNFEDTPFILDRRFYEDNPIQNDHLLDLPSHSRILDRLNQNALIFFQYPPHIFLHHSGDYFIDLLGAYINLTPFYYEDGETVYAFGYGPLQADLRGALSELHPQTNGNQTNLTLEIYLLQIDEIPPGNLPVHVFGRDCWMTEDIEMVLIGMLLSM